MVDQQDFSIPGETAASLDSRLAFTSYDDQSPTIEFTPFQALLSPSAVECYCLKTRQWLTVSVMNLTEVEWNKTAFNQLVLQPRTKKLLGGLVKQHASSLKSTSDFIKDKGKVRRLGYVVVHQL